MAETLRVSVEAAPVVAELVHDPVPGLRVVVEDGEQVAAEEAAAPDRDRAIRRLVAGLQIDRDDLRFSVARLRLLDIPANLVAVLAAVDLVLDDEEDLLVLRRDVGADIHALLLGGDFDARHLFGSPVLPVGVARDERTEERLTERVHPGVRGGGVPVLGVRPSQDVGDGGVLGQLRRGERVESTVRTSPGYHARNPSGLRGFGGSGRLRRPRLSKRGETVRRCPASATSRPMVVTAGQASATLPRQKAEEDRERMDLPLPQVRVVRPKATDLLRQRPRPLPPPRPARPR